LLYIGGVDALPTQQAQIPRPIWLPELLAYFAETKQFGVLDRIANALGPDQALAALYDALRIYRSNCVKEEPEEECPRVRTKEGQTMSPRDLLAKAEYEVSKLAELLLDLARSEEGLRIARAAALLALGKHHEIVTEGGE
jgi:CRISPR type I-A-associated protein Csa5